MTNLVRLHATSCVLVALVFRALASDFDATYPVDESSVEEGRRQLELIQANARSPVYGQCWLLAVQDLQVGCRNLSEDVQSRLAMAFASCFLAKAGKKTLTCPPSRPVSRCLEGVDTESFGAYTAFFTHTQSMCFFLRSQAWRRETGHLIHRLTSSSAEVAEQLVEAGERLRESSAVQEKILEHQTSALAGLEKVHKQGAMLEDNIKVSREVFEEFRESVHSHEAVLLNIFQRLADLQGFILGETALVSTVAYYVLGTLVCYLLTSTQRTKDARFTVFALLTVNALLEYFVGRIYSRAERNYDGNITDVSASVSAWVWLLRKLTASGVLCTLAWYAYVYQDPAVVNVAAMNQLRQDNEEIKRLLLQMRRSPKPASSPNFSMNAVPGRGSVLDVYDGTFQIGLNQTGGGLVGSPVLSDGNRSALTNLIDFWESSARSKRRVGQNAARPDMAALSDDEDGNTSRDTGRATLMSGSNSTSGSVYGGSPAMVRAGARRAGSEVVGRGSMSPVVFTPPAPVVGPPRPRAASRGRTTTAERRFRDFSADARDSSHYNLRPRRTPSVSRSRAGSIDVEERPPSSSSRKKSVSRRRGASRRRARSRHLVDTGRSPLSESGNLRT